jgi:predicted amidophosphoribosyltransferase
MRNYHKTIQNRYKVDNPVVKAYCDNCVKPYPNEGCGDAFRHFILQRIQCPPELVATHKICTYCLQLYQIAHNHLYSCNFATENSTLQAIGWATPTSKQILEGLREKSFKYVKPLVNLICAFLERLNQTKNYVLVPMPMGSFASTTGWMQVLNEVNNRFSGNSLICAITREKRMSTRNSNTQQRKHLVQEEYSLDKNLIPHLLGKKLILIDDNVTTGATLLHSVKLLQAAGASEVVPVSIERYVSPRVLQRSLSSDENEQYNKCFSFIPVSKTN